MRTMFDSTRAADIPSGSKLVMGYDDGSSAWSDADWLRFPGRILVRIGIFNNNMRVQVLDVEPGNCDALAAVPWIRGKWLRGDVPTVYCFTGAGPSGYTITDVRAECDRAGVKRPLFLVTDFDNDPSTFDPSGDPEIIGKQYANATFTGGHYDASVVADFWPGIDGGGKKVNGPILQEQSADLHGLAVGTVGTLTAIFKYPNGRVFTITKKVIAYDPEAERKVVMIYPPIDPDADETLALDCEPAVFVIDVAPS